MGLAKRLTDWVLGPKKNPTSPAESSVARRCHFEIMEPRRVMSADPVVVGVTYHEGDTGTDDTPDHFEVTFQGGSATTRLTSFTINGDQDLSGTMTDGDMFFDYDPNLPGAGGHFNFQFNAANSSGITASDIVSVAFSKDGLSMTVTLKNFEAGDKLAFDIDVDEVERSKIDKIASGIEFEGTYLKATFEDAHYTFSNRTVSVTDLGSNNQTQLQSSGRFFDHYDKLLKTGGDLAKSQLDLRSDNDQLQEDRSAAGIDVYELTPKPVVISGQVYHDENINCEKDSTESGIGGVTINLFRKNVSNGQYEFVTSTKTDAQGRYAFGTDLKLMPGEYRLVEVQPKGFLDVAASAGKVEGIADGTVLDDANGDQNIITDISIPLGGNTATQYDFKEVKPASIAGKVWHDRNDNGLIDSGEEGIGNVLIQVTRVGAKDALAKDPFAGTPSIFVRTAADGSYKVDALPPGIYEVVEINNYPGEVNPLAPYLDGKDAVGNIGGTTVGVGSNDRHSQITLCAGDRGVEYNFGELKPSSISGHVSVTTPEGLCVDPEDPRYEGLAGVTLQLYDQSGNLVATTTTDAAGYYEFTGLRNGTYTVVEVQPAGYLDGDEAPGKVNGVTLGSLTGNDRLGNITLSSGQAGTHYNFCEHRPTQICGTVWHDLDNDGVRESNEPRIGGVLIELFDNSGNKIAETRTDAEGRYCFKDLYAGTYCVKEVQPTLYLDGKESLGSVNGVSLGTSQNDAFCDIVVKGGQIADHYDFGELKPASLAGFVHTDKNGNCVFDSSVGEKPLGGVTLQLLDSSGNVLASTQTAADGSYRFDNLLPGTYSVRQIQPGDYFSVGQKPGLVDGVAGPGTSGSNSLNNIVILSGQQLTQYNFCEAPPAELHGRVWEDGPAFKTSDGLVPNDYRSQRDGIYQAGVDKALAGVKMQLWFYNTEESITPRPVTLADVLPGYYTQLGNQSNTPISVVTDANGEYHFRGLKAGNYIVIQEQPSGYVDANEIVGSTTGLSFNSGTLAQQAPQSLISTFSQSQIMDMLANVSVSAGGISVQNNFTEVRAEKTSGQQWWPPGTGTPGMSNPLPPTAPLAGYGGLAGSQPGIFTRLVGTVQNVQFQMSPDGPGRAYTWHLSVINAGQPRDLRDGERLEPQWLQASTLNNNDWNRFDMTIGHWSFATTDGNTVKSLDDSLIFGMADGLPMAGDFDGDGIDEVAVYKDGYWMIDLNRNGKWDQDDLLARLGTVEDTPVIGDWDGDGKDDIGIYGPIWERDPEAIARDPGLPNPENRPHTRAKNLPPTEVDSTSGNRVMKLTAFGRQRADAIDHVFGIDEHRLTPVTGDWNGNGIRSIGTFDGGTWRLDLNGDGEFDHRDAFARFGKDGDIPLVGDFNGDGIAQIAIFRDGAWVIDSNQNRMEDEGDQRLAFGSAGDIPVVGDWNGDGTDELALYRAVAKSTLPPAAN